MRSLVQGVLGKRISWTLITTLLLPILVMGFTPRKASAQLTRVPQVAVIDFDNLTNNQTGGILGRQATDAVVVEMTRTGRFDVTPRTQLNQQLQELGYTLPLNNVAIQKLGQALGVDYVATGAITDIRFVDKPRRAQVTLRVLLTDVASGDLANGSIRTGISPAPPPGFQPDDDTLITQAITDAAFNAVTQMANYALPEATILATRGNDEVMLNRGARDGITAGLEMNVLRGTRTVGRIRVGDVSDTTSIARITRNTMGIKPEDRARAVVQVPGYEVNQDTGEIKQFPVRESAGPQKKRGTNVVATVLGVIAAIALIAFIARGKSSNQGQGTSGVRAEAFSDLATTTTDTSSGRVRVTWDAAPDIPVNNIQEYQIFRDNVIIDVVLPNQREYIDTPTQTGTFTYSDVSPDGDLVSVTATRTALAVGVPHRYRVSVVFREVEDIGGTNQDIFRRTPVSNPSGQATPVQRPDGTAPNNTEQDLSNVRFSFQTVRGANQYVIELSQSPSFSNKKTRGPFNYAFSASAPTTTPAFDLRSDFPNLPEGTTIYWRVGARNSVDSPGPIPAREVGVPNGERYIYPSQENVRSFSVIGEPPPPPGS